MIFAAARPFIRRPSIILPPVTVALALTLLGGALRLYHFTKLSLWFDEGVSLFLARLPWRTIFFNIDIYDTHPPLYPAVLKALGPFLPEMYAGRILSVVAGTLTILVIYELGKRLMGPGVGLLAAALLAISPVHIWYSQEARMYAVVALLVALSYLALIAFHQEARALWAVLYALATASALYMDYSSIYSLAPQVLIFLWFAKVHGRKAMPIFVAAAVVVLAYLPWVPKMLGTVSGMTTERAPALGVTPGSVLDTVMSITGLAGHDHYFLGSTATPWDAWPQWDVLMVLALLPAVLVGAFALARRPALPAMVVGGLFAGTLIVGILVSLYRPGFAERTVLSSVVGWCLLLSAAVALVGRSAIPLRAVAAFSVLFVILGSAFTLSAIYTGADQDHWRDLFADLTRALPYNYPVVVFHPGTEELAGLYAPQVVEQNHIFLYGSGEVGKLPGPGADQPPAIWFVYLVLPDVPAIEARFQQNGYRRLLHNNYSTYSVNSIYVDLYVLPAAQSQVLQDLTLNDSFAGDIAQSGSWTLPSDHATVEPGNENGSRVLVLTNKAQKQYVVLLPVAFVRIYVLLLCFVGKRQYTGSVLLTRLNGRMV